MVLALKLKSWKSGSKLFKLRVSRVFTKQS